MRILFLHEVNYLEKPIFEMHEFPEYLSLRGHQVGFVQFPEGWTRKQVSAQGYTSQVPGRAAMESSITLFTPQNASGTLIGRLKTSLTFGKTFREILRNFKPDVVVSFSVPTSGWQSLRAAKGLSVPFVFRALDVSHKIRKNLFSPLIWSAERNIYKSADWVSANNPAMADYCISMGAKAESVSVDLPPIDLSHFSSSTSFRDEYRKKLGIDRDAKVVVYMGSFFYFSGLPEFIREFAKSDDPKVRLVLIGGGEQEKELRNLVRELGISERVIFTGFVGFTDLPKYLSVADVAINSMHRTLVSNAAFPNKVIQYMASGLPVVSTDLDGLRETFGKIEGLKLVSNAQEVFLESQRLLELSNLQEIGRLNQQTVARIFSKEGAVTAFESLLEKVVKSNG